MVVVVVVAIAGGVPVLAGGLLGSVGAAGDPAGAPAGSVGEGAVGSGPAPVLLGGSAGTPGRLGVAAVAGEVLTAARGA